MLRLTPPLLVLGLGLALGGCADSSEVPQDEELRAFGSELPRFAVISRDDTYTSASIGFLDAEANAVAESWLHSGTVSPKLVETIGGDAVFVTEERGDGTFTLVDRLGTDVISRFDLSTGEVTGQVRVRDSFAVNPYDVVYTDSGRAFVARFGANPNAAASDLESGNDLVEIDPVTAAILGLDDETGAIPGRIDLSEFDVEVSVDEETDLLTHASPSSALEVNGFLVIGLARFSLDFAAVAEGAFVIHDLETSTSEIVALPGLRDCERVMRVPGQVSWFAVHCAGAWGAVEPDRALLVFELDAAGHATEVAAFRESDHAGDELPLGAVIMLDADHFFGIEFGGWGAADDPDVGYLVSLSDGGTAEVIRSSVGGATLGKMAFDPDTGVLLVPDENDGVVQLEYEAGAVEHVRSFAFGLPGMRVRGFVRL